jgi:hypothetical protein
MGEGVQATKATVVIVSRPRSETIHTRGGVSLDHQGERPLGTPGNRDRPGGFHRFVVTSDTTFLPLLQAFPSGPDLPEISSATGERTTLSYHDLSLPATKLSIPLHEMDSLVAMADFIIVHPSGPHYTLKARSGSHPESPLDR